MIRLQPPEPFNFRNPDDWPRWRNRFQQFRDASGLSTETASKQVSTFLYCLGEEAESVLASTGITPDDRKDYSKVLEKVDGFFEVRKNIIYERARFNRRNQQSGETAEQYIMALYDLAQHCDYGEMKDEMIRDRLVVGIRDSSLSEKLQLDPALTLETAKKAIRQREAVHEQQKVLKGNDRTTGDCNLDAMQHRQQRTHRNRGQQRDHMRDSHSHADQRRVLNTRSGTNMRSGEKCGRCGGNRHPRAKCPAKDEQCHHCKVKGHFSKVCRNKHLSAVQEDINFTDSAFLDTISNDNKRVWNSDLLVNGKKITFKIDTGAEVTAISKETWLTLDEPELQSSDKLLYGPAKKPLKSTGHFHSDISHKGRISQQQIFVVDDLKTNLLGLPAIIDLHLVTRTDAVLTETLESKSWLQQFPKVFNGLGKLSGDYTIQLRSDARPHAIFSPRHIPLPLRQQVVDELNCMEKAGVISKVSQPTPWCAGMVVVPKKNGKVRICVDLKPLNQSVLREVHPLPKVDETLARLSGAKIFSKLDANSGFWQIPLSPSSRLLTTFITPMGRYCFNKLPFGISSAPEHFQRRMSEILANLPGVVCQMDDILIFGKTQREHDNHLEAVLRCIEEANVTLSPQKCEFSKTKLTFLGHVIDTDGIRADPEKTKAIVDMSPPTSVSELRRFLGMANQLGKFTPNLAQITQPLRELLSKSRNWIWGPSQSKAFDQVKEELSKPTTLALYDLAAPTKISADASAYGLGAVLLQKTDGLWRPVAFASRSMSETERRYAQIEKEALAATWACEKFSDFILGKNISLETDHKPLVPLLGNKNLDQLPPRILRFRLRLNRFSFDIQHVPGKELYTADTLSRAPVQCKISVDSVELQELAELCVAHVISHLPAGSKRIDSYREAQSKDVICKQVMTYCRTGWPHLKDLDQSFKLYWEFHSELTICDGLLMRGPRVVIPEVLQKEILHKLHGGHQGITRCRSRAQISVWWPGLTQQLKDFIQQCPECARDHRPNKEPLIPSTLPDYPWQQVAADLFQLKGSEYLVIVDYFSRYPEVHKLTTTTSQSIINSLKTAFARHGIPETLRTDNGPQFSSQEFAEFAKQYDFTHTTSSPHFPASNGQAERAVQTVKHLLKNTDDPPLALLSYRATPFPWCGRSPAELLMGRKIRTTLPQSTASLVPQWQYLAEFKAANDKFKDQQKRYYDDRHCVRSLPHIPDDTDVWITTNGQTTPGRTIRRADAPRSYIVQTRSGELRRNRSQLNVNPSTVTETHSATTCTNSRSPIMTRSHTGTITNPPDRLVYN